MKMMFFLKLFPFWLPQWHSDIISLGKKKDSEKEILAYIENGKVKSFPIIKSDMMQVG